MQVLRRIGATFAQGYLFSHPVPPDDVHVGNDVAPALRRYHAATVEPEG